MSQLIASVDYYTEPSRRIQHLASFFKDAAREAIQAHGPESSQSKSRLFIHEAANTIVANVLRAVPQAIELVSSQSIVTPPETWFHSWSHAMVADEKEADEVLKVVHRVLSGITYGVRVDIEDEQVIVNIDIDIRQFM